MEQMPGYNPLDQKPYCCVPACIYMTLDRRGIAHGTQEEIGAELGLTVPHEEAHLFSGVRTGRKPLAGYGTQVGKPQYSINHFFRRHNVGLTETYYPVDAIADVREFIISHISVNHDIIVCFNNRALYGEGDWGHVSLVQGVENDTVSLVDPAIDVAKLREVRLGALIEAMRYHGKDKRGGVWLQ